MEKRQSPTDTGWQNTPHPVDPQNGQPGMVRHFQAGGLTHRIWLYPHPEDTEGGKFFLSHTTYEPISRTLTEYRKAVPGTGPFNGGTHARDAVNRLKKGHSFPLPGYRFADETRISEDRARELFPHHFTDVTPKPLPPGSPPGAAIQGPPLGLPRFEDGQNKPGRHRAQ